MPMFVARGPMVISAPSGVQLGDTLGGVGNGGIADVGAPLLTSLTVTTGNALVCGFQVNDIANLGTPTVLWNGSPMTQIINNGVNIGSVIYAILNPSTGTHDLSIEPSVSAVRVYGGAATYTGVNSTFGVAFPSSDGNNSGFGTVSSLATGTLTAPTGTHILGVGGGNDNTSVASLDLSTLIADQNGAFNASAVIKDSAATGDRTVTLNQTVASVSVIVATVISP